MTGSIFIPTHAYTPGITPRHAEGCFEAVRASVHDAMTPQELQSSEAFRTGLNYLDTGYYWEAHEVLEPVWMALPDPSRERILLQALIQLANAQLKLAMKRPNAAKRLCGIVRGLLGDVGDEVGDEVVMGVALSHVIRQVATLEALI